MNPKDHLQQRIDEIVRERDQLRANNLRAKKALVTLHNHFDEFSKQRVMDEIRDIAEEIL